MGFSKSPLFRYILKTGSTIRASSLILSTTVKQYLPIVSKINKYEGTIIFKTKFIIIFSRKRH